MKALPRLVSVTTVLLVLAIVIICARGGTRYISETGLSGGVACGTLPQTPCKFLVDLASTSLMDNDIILINGTITHPSTLDFSSTPWNKNLTFASLDSTAYAKIVVSISFAAFTTSTPSRKFSFEKIEFSGAQQGVFVGPSRVNGWISAQLSFRDCRFINNANVGATADGGVASFQVHTSLF
jgi:hypothetical protein